MKPVVIVKCGRAVEAVRERRGDYEDWIAAGLGLPAERLRVVRAFEDEPLPDARTLAGVVVTGSPAMVSAREAWSERLAAWLPSLVRETVPTLAICYGHQLLAHALGGRVGPNPRGREIGTARIDFAGHAGDALLGPLPASAPFQVTHVESVLELPAGARRLASNRAERNHAFAVGRNAWGVQFHPEFDDDVIRGYLAARRASLSAEGLDPDALVRATRPTPEGPRLLGRFGALI